MTEIKIAIHYSQPPPALIDDIRKRLAEIPQDVLERAHHALMHEPIQQAGSILWKAGLCLASHELYEYRKTLFPPNALVDPLTQDAPVLRNPDVSTPDSSVGRGVPAEPLGDVNADSLPASATANPEPRNANPEQCPQPTTDNEPLTTQQSINPTIHSSIDPLPPGVQLLNDLRDVIKRYVVLPEMAAETLALWVVHTHPPLGGLDL